MEERKASKLAVFEREVAKTIEVIVALILQNTEDGIICPIEIAELKEATRVNVFVFNESMGRLRAIGFISARKQFNKSAKENRNDGKLYYYQVDVKKRPDYLSEDEIKESLAKRRKNLDRIKVREQYYTQLLFSEQDD